MNIAVVTLAVFAAVLACFGVAFALLGQANERAYWSQRDPHGNAVADATPLRDIVSHGFRYATGEFRAPLRVAAIGVLMLYAAAIFAVIAIIVALLPN